jgi:sugar phosphate isomerase/epimerase
LYELIKDYPTSEVATAFDIRHATVEGGLAWPIHFHLMRPHLGAVYVKDFVWEGRRAQNVPLGQGQVDPKFFRMLRASGYNGPISVHVEYLLDADVKANLEALATDLKTARRLLAA